LINGKKAALIPTDPKPKKSKPVKEKLSTKEALRAMGEYFEWDKKSVDFWIRQQELNNRI
jgi:hypothetical protein